MHQVPRTILLFLFCVGITAPTRAAAPVVQAFLDRHCIDCHDDAEKKAGLSVESLKAAYSDPKLHRTWVRIFDRVREGEMPPKKAPSKADRDVFLKSLGGALHQASLTQQKQGRVTIRRLSRAEYETTLHDLLGISVDLQRFLPEDSLVEGFDKVSSGLSTSATHLVKYQHGADLALLKAFPPRPEKFKSKTVRLTGKAFYDSRPKDPKRASYVRIDGDAFVFRAALYKHGSIHTPRVPVAGRYRFRA
ncbi:MAG: DUF1587 domain-containing protein, partial [Phycisphaerae bacterium]|nr:DUF1587 domain-containing protein [Phycisphaerae bacterium]